MSHVTSARVLFGPWPKYAGLRGWIRSSAPVYHKVTGAPIFTSAQPFVLNADGEATLLLPFTDNPINNPNNFTYECRWISGYSTAPPSRKFRLPGSVHSVNYMTMVEDGGIYSPPVVTPVEYDEDYPTTPTPSPSSPSSNTTTYVHTQTTPAASWVIDHPLNKKPAVALIIGGKLVYTDLEYPSNSRVAVQWPVPTSGEAHLV